MTKPSKNFGGVDAQAISVSSEAAQFQADGLLVPVAENHGVLESDLVDPANTTNPIQAAIDAVKAESYKGKVLLPYGGFVNDGTVTMADAVSFVNPYGHGQSFAENGTVVQFPSSVTTWIDFSSGGAGAEIDGVNIIGEGQSTSTGVTAVDFGSTQRGAVHFGRVGFQNFSGRVMDGTGGGGTFASQYDYIYTQNVDSGNVSAAFDIGAFGPQNHFGIAHLYPKKANSGSQSEQFNTFGGVTIDHINQGGTVGRMINEGSSDFPFILGSFNYEPDESGQFDIGIVQKNAVIGPGIINGGSTGEGSPSSTYAFTVRDADRCWVSKPVLRNSWTFGTNVINVPTDPTGPCWYWGSASDVSTSSTTGNLRAMASAGTDAA